MFRYLPALSVGPSTNSLKKNPKSRFYNKNESYFHYPFVLFSAGHLFDKKSFNEPNGFKNVIDFQVKHNDYSSILMGDSGGYQIATGKIKNTIENRNKIFKWLENNTNVAVNLDIPPYVSNTSSSTGKFDESLEQSYSNFKYFNEAQCGKTRFLNVLQGRTIDHLEKWYDKIKDFEFGGWSIGSVSLNPIMMLQSLFFLYMKGEFNKPNNRIFHILGTSKIESFVYLSFFSKLMESHGYDGLITSDSSSPNIMAAYGGYYTSIDLKTSNTVSFSNKHKYNPGAPLPCGCEVCRTITMDEIGKWDSDAYTYMVLHNVNLFKMGIDKINAIMNIKDADFVYECFSSKVSKGLRVIKQAFDSSNPISYLHMNSNAFAVEKEHSNLLDLFGEENGKESK